MLDNSGRKLHWLLPWISLSEVLQTSFYMTLLTLEQEVQATDIQRRYQAFVPVLQWLACRYHSSEYDCCTIRTHPFSRQVYRRAAPLLSLVLVSCNQERRDVFRVYLCVPTQFRNVPSRLQAVLFRIVPIGSIRYLHEFRLWNPVCQAPVSG